jgi:hypothetical protein
MAVVVRDYTLILLLGASVVLIDAALFVVDAAFFGPIVLVNATVVLIDAPLVLAIDCVDLTPLFGFGLPDGAFPRGSISRHE